MKLLPVTSMFALAVVLSTASEGQTLEPLAALERFYTSPMMERVVAWSGEQMSGNNRCIETFAADGLSSTSECEISFDLGTTWQRVSGGASRKVQ